MKLRRFTGWGRAVFGGALLLRLLYLLEMKDSIRFAFPVVDAYYHDQWARSIAAGDWMGKEAFFRAPLYPYLVAALYAVFGPEKWVVRILQAILGALTAWLVHRLGTRLFGRVAGIVAGALAATYWVFIYHEGELLIETLSVFLQTLLVSLVVAAREKPGVRRWLGAGLVLGLAADARPNILLFGIAIAAWLLADRRSVGAAPASSGGEGAGGARVPLAARARLAGAFLLGALVLIAPVTLRNWRVAGEPVLISWQGGSTYYAGNNPAADGVSPNVPGVRAYWWEGFRDIINIAQNTEKRALGPSEVSRFWFDQAFAWARQRPLDFARLQLRKAGVFWYGHEKGDDADVSIRRRESRLLALLPTGFWMVAPLGLLGIALTWRRRPEAVAAAGTGTGSIRVLVIYVAAWMVSVVAFFVTARLRMPVVPVLMVFAGASVATLASWVRARDLRRAGIAAAGLAALVALVNIDVWGLRHDNVPQEAFNRGVMYSAAGRLEDAEAAYRDAIRAAPGYVDARNNLAIILQNQGRLDESKAELDTLLAAAPRHAVALYNRGVVLERLGDRGGARQNYEQALAADPGHVESWFALGGIAQKEGRREQALAYYLRGLQMHDTIQQQMPVAAREERSSLTPALVRAYLFIGQEALAQGDSERGIANFKRAVALDPLSPGAHHALGKTYLFLGQTEQAEAELRTAIGLDPEGIDARYALALYYGSRNELRQAASQLEEILKIDPGHAGALYNMGVVRAQQGLYDLAIEMWERLLAIHPDDAEARKSLEKAREVKGR